MSIQSLSIVVPSKGCINKCAFCVSRMHSNIKYKDIMSEKIGCDLYSNRCYIDALDYSRQLGCNQLMITGECEPQQNKLFLSHLSKLLENMRDPYINIDFQTTGTLIDENYLIFLKKDLKVKTISLSVSSFDDDQNNKIIHAASFINLKELCEMIKNTGFNLRLSLNLNKEFYRYKPEELLKKCKKDYSADQVTLRKLYSSNIKCSENDWINNNVDHNVDEEYFNYIRICGTPLETLPYGNIRYSIDGVSTVADSDCMAKEQSIDIRYLILRPDCHLYTRWDDPASILM